MKTSTAALAVLLVAVLCYHVSSSPRGVNVGGSCCLQYAIKAVPLRLVVTYEYAGSHCHQPAVIFITGQGNRVCGRPGDKWVQDILNHHSNAGSG
uniref:Chemokine interleukin-8-like domain-containing protein n=2 Tax=Amazona TaxID=12929 RepID=A0A8B9FBK7_9PSIT